MPKHQDLFVLVYFSIQTACVYSSLQSFRVLFIVLLLSNILRMINRSLFGKDRLRLSYSWLAACSWLAKWYFIYCGSVVEECLGNEKTSSHYVRNSKNGHNHKIRCFKTCLQWLKGDTSSWPASPIRMQKLSIGKSERSRTLGAGACRMACRKQQATANSRRASYSLELEDGGLAKEADSISWCRPCTAELFAM